MIEVLNDSDGEQMMRRLLTWMLQELIDAEARSFIGAARHERTDAPTTQRNGTRDKVVTTGVGDVTVKIAKTRSGQALFPTLLEPRRRIDVALHAVIMQAYIEGVSTRRVDDLVVGMGGTETEDFWTEFLRTLRERGLPSTRLDKAQSARRRGSTELTGF